MPAIMIQGTSSSVGKTLICAGLCRALVRKGYAVAPCKPVSAAPFSVQIQGGAISRAAAMLAQAAKAAPGPGMNPVYAKPLGGDRYALHLLGKESGTVSRAQLRAPSKQREEAVRTALDELLAANDIVVIEGSGSPADLTGADDLPNMGAARIANAAVLLVGDIDRGGVFAALAGTLALLPEADRARVRGMIINKFRGDVSLLRSGLDMIKDITGVPVLGVLPYLRLAIEEEDLLGDGDPAQTHADALRESEIDKWADALADALDIGAMLERLGVRGA